VTVVCPRCGKEGTLELKRVGQREYVYVVHYYKDASGEWRKKRCYLGPADEYVYVSRLHSKEGLVLQGIVRVAEGRVYLNPRALQYVRDLARYIAQHVDELRGRVQAVEVEETIRELERAVGALKKLLVP
jgi:hypothetical protein